MLLRLFWQLLALLFVALGLIGAVLPGLPTTVFMLLAAWASGKGWPRLNHWLLSHPRFGPPIDHWYRYRIIPRRAKWTALLFMSFSAILIGLSTQPMWLKLTIWLVMATVLSWLVTRREQPPGEAG